MKRALYLLGLLLAVGAVVALGYFFRYRGILPPLAPLAPETGTLPPPAAGGALNSLPQTGGSASASGVPSPLTSVPVFSYFAKSVSDFVFIEANGHVSSFQGGKTAVVSASDIDNLVEATFSFDGSRILIKERLGAHSFQFKLFDTAQKLWMPVATGTEAAAWSPNNNQLALLSAKGSYDELVTIDTARASAKPQSLLQLHVSDVALLWPASSYILLESRGSAASRGTLLALDLKKKTLLAPLTDQLGLDSLWNSSAIRGLLFVSDDRGGGGRLSLVDQSGASVHDLNFVTFPSKCTFGLLPQGASSTAESLVCAIPRDQEGLSLRALPDDYDKEIFSTADDLYRIDLSRGDLTPISAGTGAFDATKLSLRNGTLFFVNRLDGKLYALSIGK